MKENTVLVSALATIMKDTAQKASPILAIIHSTEMTYRAVTRLLWCLYRFYTLANSILCMYDGSQLIQMYKEKKSHGIRL